MAKFKVVVMKPFEAFERNGCGMWERTARNGNEARQQHTTASHLSVCRASAMPSFMCLERFRQGKEAVRFHS
eukprot:scaffold1141_cov73-Skeletonema_dohrnii-CCMP3373.AAC.5